MRIAELSESSNFWTHMALLVSTRSMPVSVSVTPLTKRPCACASVDLLAYGRFTVGKERKSGGEKQFFLSKDCFFNCVAWKLITLQIISLHLSMKERDALSVTLSINIKELDKTSRLRSQWCGKRQAGGGGVYPNLPLDAVYYPPVCILGYQTLVHRWVFQISG